MRKLPRRSRARVAAPSSTTTPRSSRQGRWMLISIASLVFLISIFQVILVSHHHHHHHHHRNVADRRGKESSTLQLLQRSAWKLDKHPWNHPLPGDSNASAPQRSENRIVANDQPTDRPSMVRFLFGIMSYDHKLEKRRRKNIRRTYLSFYKDFFDATAPYRICSLVDWLQAPTGHPMLEQCQIIYTFVIGANPKGPTQLLEFNESFPLSIDPSQIHGDSERDVTYLNIQENGKFGKSPTWFKYGSTVWKERPRFDYIVKTDSDAVLYPYAFFDMVQRHHLQPYPNNPLVYGGSPFDKYMCGFPEHDHCVHLQTPTYMGGAFYFLSIDLADYITGPDCPRSQLFFPHEDMTTGNYVYSHPQRDNITWVGEPNGYLQIWRHAVKNPNRLVYWYTRYLLELGKNGIVSESQISAWNETLRSS